MSKPIAVKRGSTNAAICCALSGVVFSVAISAVLNAPELAGQIWPDDIHQFVIRCLGGTGQKDSIGSEITTVSATAIGIRLAVILLFLCGAVQFNCSRQSKSDRLAAPLWCSTLIFLSSSAWWLLWIAGEIAISPLRIFATSCLPLWISITIAVLLWTWCSAFFNDNSLKPADTQQIRPFTVLAFCMTGWIGVSYWMNYSLYQQVLIPHGDSAMYEEHLWNVWHGKGFRSYLDQGLFLGEHIQVIHLLLLPLHMLWPSHLLLELAESIALGSCAIPVYLIAKRHTNNNAAATILGIAWLFYYPMHFLDIAIDQKTFRPIALGLPFIFWLIEFCERGALKRAFVCLLVALSAKEDMALILCPLMFALAMRMDASQDTDISHDPQSQTPSPQTLRKWFYAGSVFCGVYLVIVVLFVIPAFRSGDHVHYSRYFGDLGGTPGELVKTAISDPIKVLSKAFGIRTLLYLCVFLAPVTFFPLRKPLLLLAGAFTFGMLSLLELGDGNLPPVPYHHFHAPLLPIVFWATIIAIGTARPLQIPLCRQDSVSTVQRSVLVLFCCVATSVNGSLMPMGGSFWSTESPFGYSRLYLPSDERQQQRSEMAVEVTKQIPLTARVASTDYIHTRLTHCKRSYDYSHYVRAVNNYQPGVPADTDYIVIDTGHRYSEIKRPDQIRELQQHPEQWELVPDKTDGLFLILKRKNRPRQVEVKSP